MHLPHPQASSPTSKPSTSHGSCPRNPLLLTTDFHTATQFYQEAESLHELPAHRVSFDGNFGFQIQFMYYRDRRFTGHPRRRVPTIARASVLDIRLAVFTVLAQCMMGDDKRREVWALGAPLSCYRGLKFAVGDGEEPRPKRMGQFQRFEPA